ncbi:MAG: FAD:protein FMN transferase [Gemmatimonadales bacterium]
MLLCLAACGAEPRPAVSRAWPVMGTMMSVAGWGPDSARIVVALSAARDSIDHIDSLLQRRVRIAALDSLQRDVRRRTGIVLPVDSIAFGYALDRAALALRGIVDSALLDVGGQYLWIGPAEKATHRSVGIPDPANSLVALAAVELQSGSVRTQGAGRETRGGGGGRARSVTVLAPDGLTANAWSIVLLQLGCDSALSPSRGLSVVCADSAGVRWTTELAKRVALPTARVP